MKGNYFLLCKFFRYLVRSSLSQRKWLRGLIDVHRIFPKITSAAAMAYAFPRNFRRMARLCVAEFRGFAGVKLQKLVLTLTRSPRRLRVLKLRRLSGPSVNSNEFMLRVSYLLRNEQRDTLSWGHHVSSLSVCLLPCRENLRFENVISFGCFDFALTHR